MKKQLIPLILIILMIAVLSACKNAGDGLENTTAAEEGAGVSIPAEAVSAETRTGLRTSEERMEEMISSMNEGEGFSVLDIEVPFWYPKNLDEALAYAVDLDADRTDTKVEDNTQVDSFWKAGKTDYPIGQAAYDEKGRLTDATRNNLDGTYYMIKFLYDADDGSEADEAMIINVIQENADGPGTDARRIKSYNFQFYPDDSLYSATLQVYDKNDEMTDFNSYVFNPDGEVIYYVDNATYMQMLQDRLLQGIGGVFDEIASAIDMNSLLSGAMAQ